MTRARMLAAAALMGIALGAGPARAQEDPARLQAAKDLIGAMKTEETFKQIMPTVFAQLRQVIVTANPATAKDVDAVFGPAEAKFIQRLDELKGEIAPLYARAFDARELREMIAFYRTPTGAKLIQLQPQLAQGSMAIGQSWGQRIFKEVEEDVKKQLRERGHKI